MQKLHCYWRKIKGGIEVTGRRGRRRRKLLDDLKERRGYSHLNQEALDRTMWRARFERGFGPVMRQTTKWMNENNLLLHRLSYIYIYIYIYIYSYLIKNVPQILQFCRPLAWPQVRRLLVGWEYVLGECLVTAIVQQKKLTCTFIHTYIHTYCTYIQIIKFLIM
jgi:hypothetical protein